LEYICRELKINVSLMNDYSQSDEIETYLPELETGRTDLKGKTDGQRPHFASWKYVLVAVVVLGSLFYLNYNFDNLSSLPAETALPAPVIDAQVISGTYTLKSVGADGVEYSTVEFETLGDKRIKLSILSEYEAIELDGTMIDNEVIQCEQLGRGIVSVNTEEGLVTIEFNNTDINKSCVLSKYYRF